MYLDVGTTPSSRLEIDPFEPSLRKSSYKRCNIQQLSHEEVLFEGKSGVKTVLVMRNMHNETKNSRFEIKKYS